MKRLLLLLLFAATTLPVLEAFGKQEAGDESSGAFHGRMEANGDYQPGPLTGISGQMCELQLRKLLEAQGASRKENVAAGNQVNGV